MRAQLALVVVLTACSSDGEEATDTLDSAAFAGPSADCATLGLEVRPFDDGEPGYRRRELAGDLTLATDEGKWVLSEQWSGCDSYVFATDGERFPDGSTFWTDADIAGMLELSPPNVHYFFASTSSDPATVAANLDLIRDEITAGLRTRPAGDAPGARGWWRKRLHVVKRSAYEIGGYTGELYRRGGNGAPTGDGFAIDRMQRLRGIGSLADVRRQDASLPFPFRPNLALIANEPRYFEFELARQARLDAEDPLIVTAWSGEILEEFAETTVDFPSAAELADYDTLEIDLSAFCPDPDAYEVGNCGAWDYLAHIRLEDPEDPDKLIEMARFITTYHRAGRYLVDATPMLALIDGPARIRYDFAPSWNTQPTLTHLDFRFTNRGTGHRPTQVVPLYRGGGFNSAYNDGREPVDVAIAAGAKRVELRAITTGHGNATSQCAEFCNHQHAFTVGGTEFLQEFPEPGESLGCMDKVDQGVIPNQAGTWWLGRGGWCPGWQVDPWVQDLTELATSGETLTVSYEGRFGGQAPPPDDAGNIELSSWIVVYE